MRALLVNPWIYDFAAYDLWMKPLGFLYLANVMKNSGWDIEFIDVLDRNHPMVKSKFHKTEKFGCGHYYSEEVEKPQALKSIRIKRRYKRYGLPPDKFTALCEDVLKRGKPGSIFVTSGMTYWYPGAFEAISILKKIFKDVPVVFGGTYAALCNDHAKNLSGADLAAKSGNILQEKSFTDFPAPCYDFYAELEYAAIRASAGCVFKCTYCASFLINDTCVHKDPKKVANEIEELYTKRKIIDFAFYDDALLADAGNYFKPLMKEIIQRGIKCNFHTPNALHACFIDAETAALMKQGGFIEPRIGFETSSDEIQKKTGGKISNKDFLDALNCLKNSGYEPSEIIVYTMAGLPRENIDGLRSSIDYLKGLGVKISLTEFSPVPGTPDFDLACKFTKFPLYDEPLFQNNSVFNLIRNDFDPAELNELKLSVKEYNNSIHN